MVIGIQQAIMDKQLFMLPYGDTAFKPAKGSVQPQNSEGVKSPTFEE